MIAGIPKDDLYEESNFVPIDGPFCEQDAIEQFKSPEGIQNWLKRFDEQTNVPIYDGEKSTLYNPDFAKFFLNLCKSLVLWSAVNAKFFKADVNANSTANVESYFKDVKTSLKNEIPCRADEFIAAHIDMINGMVIDASQDYVEFVNAAGGLAQFRESIPSDENETDLNKTPLMDELAENFTTNEENISGGANNSNIGDSEVNDHLQNTNNNTDIAENSTCNDENTLDKENISDDGNNSKISDSETNSQSQSICNNPTLTSSTPNAKKKSLASNLNEKDKWSKSKRGKGKFLRPMPFLKLMTSEKKTPKIGFLRNASLSVVVHKINGRNIKLKNTCGIDSLVQVTSN